MVVVLVLVPGHGLQDHVVQAEPHLCIGLGHTKPVCRRELPPLAILESFDDDMTLLAVLIAVSPPPVRRQKKVS